LIKPLNTDTSGKRIWGLNPNVFFLGIVSLLAGWLWQAYSPAATFYLGAGLAFLAMLGMLTLIRE
jgi:hypothetical protein